MTLFIQDRANPEYVRYATRSVINQAMKSDYLVPRVQNLLEASYKGPQIISPESTSNPEMTTGANTSHPTPVGLSSMSKVVIATLCSAVVGIVAAFVLFKKVFNSKQNCFAACDGTGMDKSYIDNAHFQSPRGVNEGFYTATGNAHGMDNMQVVQYDIANGLNIIHEDSEVSSTARSYATSNMTNNMSRVDISCDTSIAWSEASEKTMTTSNKNRTPTYGEGAGDLHII
eukprot:scaffold178_cov269-Chaetoceros_neogracile.AAC.9